MIYLDYAATAPLSEEALHVFSEASRKAFANSNSLHDEGDLAGSLLEACRSKLAGLIGGTAKGICFTSGGSESNVLAVDTLLANAEGKNHIIASALEHSSIYNYLTFLQRKGFEITFLMPDNHGKLHVDSIREALRENTALVTVQHVNSEIGCIQNLQEIGEWLLKQPVYFHSDCVQSFGKVSLKADEWGLDAVSLSSHKIYGPKGVGCLYLNPRHVFKPNIHGGTHENGFRAGTVNVPGIAAFAAAAEQACSGMESESLRLSELRDVFFEMLKPFKDHVHIINQHSPDQVPSIIGLHIKGIEGQYMLLESNRRGVAISTGTACQIGMQEPSRALLSIGLPPQAALQYIRISTGKYTTADDLKKMAGIIGRTLSERQAERK
ncbi:IscS subfamily cysteine desulfurase [Metabacillus indicus]|uniref:Aminotransferase class V domain-containing protein n=1 Tax=Metabacillus indicus TaxID=246786 RepID=A0A084GWY1_METID|nr:IscS subfamily cysteine desulfurase [Metabacillus indicus]KEZ51843.1 hypothetical protein GS18_0212095 [Metabacillus indicus]